MLPWGIFSRNTPNLVTFITKYFDQLEIGTLFFLSEIRDCVFSYPKYVIVLSVLCFKVFTLLTDY